VKEHHVKKYMRQAKHFGEDQNNCHSRKIGTVIVDQHDRKVVSMGYNSPPRDTPHCDSKDYLLNNFWNQITKDEKQYIYEQLSNEIEPIYPDGVTEKDLKEFFANKYDGCKTCPRKLVNAPSGARLELCSCAHSEANAITNATEDLYGCTMLAWCGVACQECTKLIINSGIKKCYFIDWGADYSVGSRWLFEKAKVEIFVNSPEYYLNDEVDLNIDTDLNA